MAATTTLLDLVTPTQGTLSGTWGDTVNYGISDYVDIAIAGTLSFAGDGAITLVNTIGSASGNNIGATTAQYMVIRVTGTLTTPKIITAPSRSKLYLVDNAATGSTVSFIRSGQTPAVSIAVGEKAFVFYNGTDYVKVASSVVSASNITGTVATTNGGTGLTSFTSGGVVFASSSSVLATGSALTFNGTNLGLGVTPSAWVTAKAFQVGSFGSLASGAAGVDTQLGNNCFYDGTNWKYIASQEAARMQINRNVFAWFNAAAGTAGDTISFTQAMTLDASGRLGIGTSSPSGKLHVIGSGTQILMEPSLGSGDTEIMIGRGFSLSGTPAIVGTKSFVNCAFEGSDDNAYSAFGYVTTAVGTRSQIATAFYIETKSAGSSTPAERARIDAVGNVLVGGTAARGTTVGAAHLDLFNGTAPAGTLTNGVSLYSDSGDLKFMNAAGDAFDVGYRNIPQNSQSAAYTLVLADAGKHIFHPVGDNNARTFTIPADSSVPYPVGTAITFINMAAANVTIAITSDTMYLSSAGTTGSRTLAQYGSATAIKITSTNWLISGSGLT
jgi:hypothetical protein